MRKQSVFVVATGIAAAVALTVSSAAFAAVQVTPKAVTPTQQLTATVTPIPVQGDFNGDQIDDVFWYVPGSGADELWSGKARLDDNATTLANRFTVSSKPISGTYKPIPGDFNGDGRTDIFWYGPGKAADSVWYFNADNTVVSKTISISGVYTPVVANFDRVDATNDTEQDDIFWYSTTGKSSLWSGNPDNTFSSVTYNTSPPAGATLLVGNWRQTNMANGASEYPDILFYVPGTKADAIWAGDGTGYFGTSEVTINGSYKALIGDFDADTSAPNLTDIFWYAPGTKADSVWMNTGSAFTSIGQTVNGTSFKPIVITPEVDRPGNDMIVWNNPTGADAVWRTTGSTGTFLYVSTGYGSFGGTDPGTRSPLLGDMDNSSSMSDKWDTDVLWWAPGNETAQTEQMWLEFGNIT